MCLDAAEHTESTGAHKCRAKGEGTKSALLRDV